MTHPAGAIPPHPLRLVRSDGPLSRRAAPPSRDDHAAVLRENRRAADARLTADDARRILALRTAEALDGGRAAVLRPESRRRLLQLAHMLGVRAFDANLVIAIVQDGARRGETPSPNAAASDHRLSIVGAAAHAAIDHRAAAPIDTAELASIETLHTRRRWDRPRRAPSAILLQAAAALGVGLVLLLAIIAWLTG